MKSIGISLILFLSLGLSVLAQGTLTTSPVSLDADQAAKITFQASSASQLYNYSGDVYAHIGIVEGSDWMYVPADWHINIEKCKMASEGNNTWSLTLSPSIRSWFGAEELQFPLQKIGLVIRSADGTKKGIQEDSFLPVTDNAQRITPGPIVFEACPAGVREGINVVDNSTVTFVLYEKSKSGKRKDFAYLIGDFNDWKIDNDYQMKRDEAAGCWWYTVSGLNPDVEYAFQYLVGMTQGGTIRVGDAYCEKILDAGNDGYIPASTYPNLKEYPHGKTIGIVSVFKIKEEAYQWQVTNFQKPKRDNLIIYELLLRDFTDTGDLNGVMAKLDYLQKLGVNAIELMPCQEFTGNDSWGYNPIFSFAMDKAYGTKNMYKAFIDECHRRGIAVLLDVVYNHADHNSPLVKLYFDGQQPTADNPWFNVSAPHPYSAFNDFNHESSLTRAFVKRNLEFLLTEYKFDGFRFDLTKGFTNKTSSESTASNYDQTRIDILKDYNATIKAVNPETFVILEHFCATSEERALAEDGMMLWRNMNWAFNESTKGNAADFTGLYADGIVMPKSSLVAYMESHDEERNAFMTGLGLSARLRHIACNAAFFLTVPGPKMIWQFGEYGYDIPIDYNGRTGRKPLHWEYLDDERRYTLFETYSKLIALRMSYPELFSSTASFTWQVGTTNWSNRYLCLTQGDKSVVIVGNLGKSASTASYAFPNTGVWHDYFEDGATIDVTASTHQIPLSAHVFKVYTNFVPQIISEVETIEKDTDGVIVFPNPTPDMLFVKDEEVHSISVYTLSGALVKQVNRQTEISLGELKKGVYLVRIQTGNEAKTVKVMKD